MKTWAFLILAFAAVALGQSVLTYPGWRGNNLVTNDTFPYGMQWMYPCKLHPMKSSHPLRLKDLYTGPGLMMMQAAEFLLRKTEHIGRPQAELSHSSLAGIKDMCLPLRIST